MAGETVRIALSTKDDICWDLVSDWLKTCQSSHRQCSTTTQDPNWLPSRLVDVGEVEQDSIRLVETTARDQLPGTRYLALSHCWGEQKFLVMTTDNREHFKKGILISTLSPNFQDSIYATRRLGF